jgi:hypothetical protein
MVAKISMKTNALLALALLTAAGLLTGRAEAASAVAIDDHGHLVHSKGQPTREIAIEHVVDGARQLYGPHANVRLIASSDVTGYCAIAVASKVNGHGYLVGVSLAKRSQAEADNMAITHCLKAGGVDPKVKWRWHG